MNRELPKVALIPGGGGIRPIAAIPLFSFPEAEKIPVRLLVGCSGGSILAAGLASGDTPHQMLHDTLQTQIQTMKKSCK